MFCIHVTFLSASFIILYIILIIIFFHLFISFLELIQREWLDGDHPFSLRHSHVTSAPEKERAPLFLLFLDTVWQVNTFPVLNLFLKLVLHCFHEYVLVLHV